MLLVNSGVVMPSSSKSISIDDKNITAATDIVNKEFDRKWSNYFNYLIEKDIKSRKDKNNK